MEYLTHKIMWLYPEELLHSLFLSQLFILVTSSILINIFSIDYAVYDSKFISTTLLLLLLTYYHIFILPLVLIFSSVSSSPAMITLFYPLTLTSSHSIILLSFLLLLPCSSGVEKREDHTSSVGDLLRDIETALDTVLDEREKQLQQQVRYRTHTYPFTPLILLTMWYCLIFNYFCLHFHHFRFSVFCHGVHVTSSCFLLHLASRHSVCYTFNRPNLGHIITCKSFKLIIS